MMGYHMRGSDILETIHAVAPADWPARIDHTGGGCATVYAGPPSTDGNGDTRYPLVIGPGWWAEDGTRFDTDDCYAGPDDDGDTTPARVRGVGDVVLAVRVALGEVCRDCGLSASGHLTADECEAHGIDTRDGRGCALVCRVLGS